MSRRLTSLHYLLFAGTVAAGAINCAASAQSDSGSISGAHILIGSGFKRMLADSKTSAVSKSNADSKKLLNEGMKLLGTGREGEAEVVLHNAVIADESSADCRLNYGICLYKLGRYYGALSQLEKAIEIDKHDAQAYLYLGHCYSKTGKISDAIRCYDNYLELNPSDPDSEKYQALVGVLKAQVQAQAQSSAPNKSTASGDYMKETTATGLYRWPESRMPITVFIEPVADSVNGYRAEFDDVLRHAFQEWTSVSKSKARFEVVKTRDNAEMIVTWTDDMQAPELKAEAGKASVFQDSEGIKSAKLLLLTVSPFKQGPLTCESLYLVCLHEIGHALGLVCHSPYPDDIMYPLLSAQTGITPRDARTLAAVYAAADESQVVASGDASPADESEFSRLSPANQASLLLKIGTKAVFAGKYEESIASLEKSLKLDSTNKLAKSNLSVAANNLALQKQSQDERLKLLHKAVFWNPESESGRLNLTSTLNVMGIDPEDPAARIKLADKLESSSDLIGACAELSESLRLKPDSKVSDRLQAIRKKLGYSD